MATAGADRFVTIDLHNQVQQSIPAFGRMCFQRNPDVLSNIFSFSNLHLLSFVATYFSFAKCFLHIILVILIDSW